MEALISLIVQVFKVIFTTGLERHDAQVKETEHETNAQSFTDALAEAPATAPDPAVVAALDDQHDRVQQALRDSGFTADGSGSEGNSGQPVQGQGTAPQSATILPRRPTEALIARLKKEELFSPKSFWDIEQWTYGYGCCAPGEGATITEPAAAVLLVKRAQQSVDEFFILFAGHEHKFNEVRQECFIDMLFNMGLGNSKKGVRSFVNTLDKIFSYDQPNWSRVAYNLEQSKWYRQVGKRAERICAQIAKGEYA